MRQAAGTSDCDSDSLVTGFVRANKASEYRKNGNRFDKDPPTNRPVYFHFLCGLSKRFCREKQSAQEHLHTQYC